MLSRTQKFNMFTECKCERARDRRRYRRHPGRSATGSEATKNDSTIIEIHNFYYVSCEINPPYAVPSLYVNRPPIAVLPSASAFRSYTYSDFPLGLQDSHCPYLPGLASCRLGKRRQASNRRQHGRQALSHD